MFRPPLGRAIGATAVVVIALTGCGGGSNTTSTSASRWQQLSPEEKQKATDQVIAFSLLKALPEVRQKQICAGFIGRLPSGQHVSLSDQVRLMDVAKVGGERLAADEVEVRATRPTVVRARRGQGWAVALDLSSTTSLRGEGIAPSRPAR